MFSRSERLPVHLFLRTRGRSFHNEHFSLKMFYPKETSQKSSTSRFGVFLSSRLFSKAVIRNKLKRTIFESMYRMRTTLPLRDYLIIPTATAQKLTFSEITDSLRSLFQKITL